jgi:hypothetical protein
MNPSTRSSIYDLRACREATYQSTAPSDHKEHRVGTNELVRSQRGLRTNTLIAMCREARERKSSIATMFANNHVDRDDDRDSSIAIAMMIAWAIDLIMMMIEEHDVCAYERSPRSTWGDSYDRHNQPMRLIAMKLQKCQFDRGESRMNELVCLRWNSRTSTQIAMQLRTSNSIVTRVAWMSKSASNDDCD